MKVKLHSLVLSREVLPHRAMAHWSMCVFFLVLWWFLKQILHLNALSDVLVKESKWTKMFFGEGQASLSFSHLNKDDEGLYTLRIVSRGGINEHSAFLFVRGTSGPGCEGGPGTGLCTGRGDLRQLEDEAKGGSRVTLLPGDSQMVRWTSPRCTSDRILTASP